MINYSNESVRRQNRLMEQDDAMRLLAHGEYGVLSMVVDGQAYGVPMSYVWDGQDSIYFHCAQQGAKMKCIGGTVSFAVVGHTQVLSAQFSTEYESIIAKGILSQVLCEAEKMLALELLLDKYSAADKVAGMDYARRAIEKTAILRLDIESMSGKVRQKSK